jgi:Icc-related predicted phosphoesterase
MGFSGEPSVARYRIFFVTDLHGSDVCFRKFLNSIPIYKPDLLIYGGDVLGKILVPIFPEESGGYRWYPDGRSSRHFENEGLPTLERTIADSGRYSIVVDADGWRRLQNSNTESEETFRAKAKERVRQWLGLIGERTGSRGIPVVMNVGNDDTDDILELLRNEGPPNLLIPEGRIVRAGPYEIFGCGYANMTPWHCPRDLTEEDLRKVLDRTQGQIGNPRRTILDIHAPPWNTGLDLAPELDENLKPKAVSGQILVHHVGSTSVRELIESVRPVLSLHGHIHESKAVDDVAGTPVYNPGSAYFSGQLHGLLVDLDGDRVTSHLFVTG